MPQIETWFRLPAAQTKPDVPEGLWYKDFGSFKLCGAG
jgi:hypothetical protein